LLCEACICGKSSKVCRDIAPCPRAALPHEQCDQPMCPAAVARSCEPDGFADDGLVHSAVCGAIGPCNMQYHQILGRGRRRHQLIEFGAPVTGAIGNGGLPEALWSKRQYDSASHAEPLRLLQCQDIRTARRRAYERGCPDICQRVADAAADCAYLIQRKSRRLRAGTVDPPAREGDHCGRGTWCVFGHSQVCHPTPVGLYCVVDSSDDLSDAPRAVVGEGGSQMPLNPASLKDKTRQRRLLALDGGGIRGVLSLEILLELETQLRAARGAGAEFRLCQYFDYIGGTSTGAIIAAALARGWSVSKLIEFYVSSGKQIFDSAAILARWKNLYKSEPLKAMLQSDAVFGASTTLEPQFLECLLLVVMKNKTTDSPWPLSSNPFARYNDITRPDCNLKIPLWQVVRASTAAPVYFPPEVVQWDPSDPRKSFVFVDGGITPYNNPALLMFRMATDPAYRLEWPASERDLLVISVGTGAARSPVDDVASPEANVLQNMATLPGTLMYASAVEQDINCRAIGRCVAGAAIDAELGDMIVRDKDNAPMPLTVDCGRRFLYARYNADLSGAGLMQLGLGALDPKEVQKMDAVDNIADLRRIGKAAARAIDVQNFAPFL
jgi:predicted acylesterase/phospholipase RssA